MLAPPAPWVGLRAHVHDLTRAGGWPVDLDPTQVLAYVRSADLWPTDTLVVAAQGHRLLLEMTGRGDIRSVPSEGESEARTRPLFGR